MTMMMMMTRIVKQKKKKEFVRSEIKSAYTGFQQIQSNISEYVSRLVTDCSTVVSGYTDNTVTVNLIPARYTI